MNAEDLKNLRVEIALGKTSFSGKDGRRLPEDRQKRRQKLETCMLSEEGNSFELSLEDRNNRVWAVIKAENEGPVTRLTLERRQGGWNRIKITIPVGEAEHFYGCGERAPEADLKGRRVVIWSACRGEPARKYRKIIDEEITGPVPRSRMPGTCYAMPTFISSAGYFVHVDTSACAAFDFTVPGQVTLELRRNAPIVIGRADSYPELSKVLASVLGRPGSLPGWVHDGVILGAQKGTAGIRRTLARVREAGVPVAGIMCRDWCGGIETADGYQAFWNWEIDDTLYPNFPDQIALWREEGIRVLGYINPMLALDGELYKYASAQGYCVKNARGEDYPVAVATRPAAMVDLTNPAARTWLVHLIRKNLIDAGFSGWMADYGDYLPADAVLMSGEKPENIHNRWPALWAGLNRKAIRDSGREDDIFFFTGTGSQGSVPETCLMESGQRRADFSIDGGLPGAIPAALSMGMSGITGAFSIAGGHLSAGPEGRTREVCLRWLEMNAFSPILMTGEGGRPDLDVSFDEDDELLKALRVSAKTHRALREYLEICEAEAADGIPIMRPLFYHYDEPAAYGQPYEYLLGRDILVAPVIEEGVTRRRVCFPEDKWIHLFTGEVYHGGVYLVQAPFGEPPVFVRAGSEFRRKLRGFRDIK